MSIWLSLINDGAVSIFGSVLSASFCDALHTRKNRRVFWCGMVVVLLLQCLIYSVWDAELLRRMYPLIVHLPLTLLLYGMTGKLLWTVISVLTAYLCCQLRRWLALLAVALISGNAMIQDAVELIVTLPILLVLLRFVAPAVRQFVLHTTRLQLQFGAIPAIYYVFDYATVVYTDFLTSGSPVVVEFMPLVCCVGYLLFLLYDAAQEQKQLRLRQIQDCLDVQLKQSVREISALRESRELTARYRHDLRHHLQFLLSCLENDREEQAKEYISEICQGMEVQRVRRYCENETVNLILSSFAGRAERAGIPMNICGALPEFLQIEERDLCVLLSNALENAIHACKPLADEGKACSIDVQFYEKEGVFFLQIINSYGKEPRFEKGIPVSDSPGHGIGVQSICAIAERYGGIYSFCAKEGTFILRISF